MKRFLPYVLATALTTTLATPVYPCGNSPRNSTVTSTARLVETYQPRTIQTGDRVWKLAQRATGETDPSKTASVVNRTVKYTVEKKNGPRRLLEDVDGDGIRGDKVMPGDVVYFIVQKPVKEVAEAAPLSPEEMRKAALTRNGFLREMHKRSYSFSIIDGGWWNLTLDTALAKPPEKIYLKPPLRDKNRFHKWSEEGIFTGRLETTPSGLICVLHDEFPDRILEDIAKQYGIRIEIDYSRC